MHAVQVRVRSVLWALVMTALVAGKAHAADRFVSTAGSDTANDCLTSASPCRTVGYALTQAASGDTVKVAGGSYRENLTVNTATTLTLSGSWANNFSTQDTATTPTVLQQARGESVVTVLADGITVAFSADGLTIQGGKEVFFPGGGGIQGQASAGGSLTLTLSRLVLQRNMSVDYGGGLTVRAVDAGTNLSVTLTDSTIIKNASGFEGGGINISSDQQNSIVNVVLDGVLLKRNRSISGGALSIHSIGSVGDNAQVSVKNSVFDGNRGRLDGGGIFAANAGCPMGACPLKVTNSVFRNNRAQLGGGVMMNPGGADLTNVTATKNGASGSTFEPGSGGGGVLLRDGTILNSILWGNRGAHPRDLQAFFGVVGLDHSDVDEQSGSVTDLGGNINANPLFTVPGDIHLRAGSPCIDTGTCTGAPTTDFEGDPRPTGAGCDMGADEFVP